MKYTAIVTLALALASCAKVTEPTCDSKTVYQVTHKTWHENGKTKLICPPSSPMFGQHDIQMSETTIELTDTAFIVSQLMNEGWMTGHSPMTWNGCTPETVGCHTVLFFDGEQLSWYQGDVLITYYIQAL